MSDKIIMDKKEEYWKCPTCHYRITNTQLQATRLNFRCNGTFGTYPRVIQCAKHLSDYVLIKEN